MNLQCSREFVAIVIRPVDGACNLSCQYCNAGSEIKKPLLMSEAILEALVCQLSQLRYLYVQFTWHGGEPLLAGLDFYKKVVDLQKKYYGSNAVGKQYDNAIQTNALLLDPEYLDYFEKEKFYIGVSIDGPDFSANRFRLSEKNAHVMISRITANCRQIREREMSLVIISVIHSANFNRARDLYSFYKCLDPAKVSFNPRFLRNEPDSENISPQAFGSFLSDILEVRSLEVANGEKPLNLGILDEVQRVAEGKDPRLCFFSQTCQRFLSIDRLGAIYATCLTEVGVKLGNVDQEGIDGCIKRFAGSPLPQVGAMIKDTPFAGTATATWQGCPKYAKQGVDQYLGQYHNLLKGITGKQ